MPRITQQQMIAIYGEVLTLAEIVTMLGELMHESVYDQLGGDRAAQLYKVVQEHQRAAQNAQHRAIDTMLDRFPKMELHPLTGDVLDPPQG